VGRVHIHLERTSQSSGSCRRQGRRLACLIEEATDPKVAATARLLGEKVGARHHSPHGSLVPRDDWCDPCCGQVRAEGDGLAAAIGAIDELHAMGGDAFWAKLTERERKHSEGLRRLVVGASLVMGAALVSVALGFSRLYRRRL
jgi:hypothetical protein